MKRQVLQLMTITKQCNRCGIEKPLIDFYKSNAVKDGYRNQCKACCKELQSCRDKKIRLDTPTIVKTNLNAKSEKVALQSMVEILAEYPNLLEPLFLDQFKEWIMGSNPDFDTAITEHIYLPQEKRVLAKRLHKLAEQLEK